MREHGVQVLGRSNDVELTAQDMVSVPQFSEVWKALGVAVKQSHAEALFNKYGQTSRGLLPVMVRCKCTCRANACTTALAPAFSSTPFASLPEPLLYPALQGTSQVLC
jgi:hypothetical protein